MDERLIKRGPAPGRKTQGAGPLLFARSVDPHCIFGLTDAARNRPRHLSPRPGTPRNQAPGISGNLLALPVKNVAETTRKPMLLFLLFGLFLLRAAQRTSSVSLSLQRQSFRIGCCRF